MTRGRVKKHANKAKVRRNAPWMQKCRICEGSFSTRGGGFDQHLSKCIEHQLEILAMMSVILPYMPNPAREEAHIFVKEGLDLIHSILCPTS